MKKVVFVLMLIAGVLSSCTKQASNQLASPVSEEVTAKGGQGKGKGKGRDKSIIEQSVNATAGASFTITASGNTISWTSPALEPGNAYTWVEVDIYEDSSGVYLKRVGGAMKYVNSTTPVNSYTFNTEWNTILPAGTWAVKAFVWQATPNPLSYVLGQPDYITNSWIQHESNVLPSVTFN